MKTSYPGAEAERVSTPEISTSRVRAARALAFVGIGSLVLSLGITPALAGPAEVLDEVRVSGTLLVLPDEPLTVGEADPAAGGAVWLATTAGPLIPIDENTLSHVGIEDLVTGATLHGTVELPQPAIEAVSEATQDAAESGEARPTTGEILQTAADALVETEQALPLTDAEVTVPVAEAASTGIAHQADVVMFAKSGQNVPSETEIEALVDRVSSYWKTQSGGLITGITTSSVKFRAIASADVCSATTAWSKAAAAFDRTLTSYASSGSTRHLIALVLDSSCGAGMGSVGSKLNGGFIWANLDDYTAARGAVVGAQTVAHEVGHNFGLGHANARVCSGSTPDSATSAAGSAVSPCVDSEYGDLWSVMGVGIRGYTSRPAALAINQRDFLGAATGEAMQTVTPAGGTSQTFALNTLTASSGLRGLRVEPELGAPFYVEYRDGTGQDSGMPQATGTPVVVIRDGKKLRVTPGVRVIKSLARTSGAGSTVLSRSSSGYYTQVLTPNQTVTPEGNSARVKVLSVSGGIATVRVYFADPFLTAAEPTIVGEPRTGVSLAARATGWAPQAESLKYQWLRSGAEVPGATSSKYAVTSADLGEQISVRVTGVRAGDTETVDSLGTASILRSMRSQKPEVSGTSKVGRVLTASRGSWAPSGLSFSYRWLRNGKSIGGATSSKYRLKSADRGKKISVKILARKSGYYPTVVYSSSRTIK